MNPKLSHILLVDDDEATVFIHKIFLRKLLPGAKISTAWNGRAALDVLTSLAASDSLPQLILLDLNMPLLNGWDFLTAFEQQFPGAGTYPIIFIVTASMNPDDEQRASQYKRVARFVTKPLDSIDYPEALSVYFDLEASPT